jgi:hypothetical protein
VLPYGEPRNDWLEIDADYTRRSRTLRFLDDSAFDEYFQDGEKDADAALVFLRNNSYFVVTMCLSVSFAKASIFP